MSPTQIPWDSYAWVHPIMARGSVARLAGAGTMDALKQVVPEVPL